jgi:hypothetical protein
MELARGRAEFAALGKLVAGLDNWRSQVGGGRVRGARVGHACGGVGERIGPAEAQRLAAGTSLRARSGGDRGDLSGQVAALQQAADELVQSYAAAARPPAAALNASADAADGAPAAAEAASQAAAAVVEAAVVGRLREAEELAARAAVVEAEEWGEERAAAGLAAARWRLRALQALAAGTALDDLQALACEAPAIAAAAAAGCQGGAAVGQGVGDGAVAAWDGGLVGRLEARRLAAEEWVGRAGAAMRGKEVRPDRLGAATRQRVHRRRHCRAAAGVPAPRAGLRARAGSGSADSRVALACARGGWTVSAAAARNRIMGQGDERRPRIRPGYTFRGHSTIQWSRWTPLQGVCLLLGYPAQPDADLEGRRRRHA